jgi:hypothetical protein
MLQKDRQYRRGHRRNRRPKNGFLGYFLINFNSEKPSFIISAYKSLTILFFKYKIIF